MKGLFEIASGSIIGTEHVGRGRLLIGQNNQDSCFGWQDDRLTIMVVTDGCGSSKVSEFGAHFGAKVLVRFIRHWAFDVSPDNPVFWDKIQQGLLSEIGQVAKMLGGNFSEIINDYFLFSIVGAIISQDFTWIFSFGDGVYAVNGDLVILGPFAGNAPPYLAYYLLDPEIFPSLGYPGKFQVLKRLLTAELNTLLLGTDGVEGFVSSSIKKLPGREELVGPLSQFWEQDRYFTNPDNIRRRLALVNSFHIGTSADGQVVRTSGLLFDDTTLMTCRRKRERRLS